MAMERTRTLRVDLIHVTQDQVIEFVKSQKWSRAILYHEIADVTGKPHLQGWVQFDTKAIETNFWKHRFPKWCKDMGMPSDDHSCVTVKKDTYFVYTTKDKRCVWSVGVSDEERIANEEKSYKKLPKVTDFPKLVMEKMKTYTTEYTRAHVAYELISLYKLVQKPMYRATMIATVDMLMVNLVGDEAQWQLANSF